MKNNKKKKNKENKINFLELHPIMTYLSLTAGIMVLSFILFMLNAGATYQEFSLLTLDYNPTMEHVIPLLNLSGLKYIFTYSVSNFANFPVLTNLIIILIGIGIMEKSGFIKTSVTMLTKKAKKTTVTFSLILLCLLASVVGDIAYVILLPIIALFFYHSKRNPFIGLIAGYGALTIGSSLSFIFTAVDSSLRNITVLNAGVLQVGYNFNINALLFVNVIAVIALSFFLTRLTENHIAKKLPKYDFTETELEEDIVTKKELKAMFLALFTGAIYVAIIIYNIIPDLYLSGNLLDDSQKLYIDKLFSTESFFSNGFVFIIAFLFIIWGLVYGLRTKNIKTDKDIVDGMSYSLDGIGKTLLLIFAASICISVYEASNIGITMTVYLANLIETLNFSSMPLVILLLFVSVFATIILPDPVTKWTIVASTAIPAFMNVGLTPEFAQMIFRLGESISMGLTPIFIYFIVYLALIEKYNQNKKSIGIYQAIKYQMPYAIVTLVIILVILIVFYVTNIPLGIEGFISG